MDRSVDALWSKRAGEFWRDSLPYFRYMAQSGLPGVTIMLLLAGLAGYASAAICRRHFPLRWLASSFLTPVVCWSPLDMAAGGGYRLSGAAGSGDGSVFETIISI